MCVTRKQHSPASGECRLADAHAHSRRLVSIVKMATVLEECTTEDKRSVVRFLLAKGLM
jgi:hypothetical protein